LRLHSYVVAHDFGFAPNPFHGVCTLATCKPRIREYAKVGDYVVGTGCAKRKRSGYLVYFLRVDEITTFDRYWLDPRFECKRPNLCGSKMQAFGDNIYHTDSVTGDWLQENSHHSMRDGRPNLSNIEHDTTSLKVLIGWDFAYWGGEGPVISAQFRDFDGTDLCIGRGHRNSFPEKMATDFVAWLRSLGVKGYVGRPLDWIQSP
jgi:Nucleotide modification associated domain 2